MKVFVLMFTGSVEDEIRETMTSLFKEKYTLTDKNNFVFLKRKKFKLDHPIVSLGLNGTLVKSKHYLDKES